MFFNYITRPLQVHACVWEIITQKILPNVLKVKLHSKCRTSIYFCVRAGCTILMVSCSSKHSSQCLSDKPFLRNIIHVVFLDTTRKLQVLRGRSAYRTTPILSETFFVLFRFALEIQLESYSLRHASVVVDIVYLYCRPVHTSLFDPKLCLTTKLTYLI